MAQNAPEREASVVPDRIDTAGGSQFVEDVAERDFVPAAYFVVPADALNEIVGYLMQQPWRDTNQLLQSVNGVRTLDEYGVR